ncbi:MAG TPA: acyltransferase family protein [Acidimicrobiales bacterium]|nr:acyltransferase family protein [Acidimicrobiales bacterium]
MLTRARPAADRVDDAPTPPPFAYQPGLDGLRALAVIGIIAYHLNYSWAGGGFLCVDLFFMISGLLITSLLIREWQRGGTIGLRRFWGRRARRLLPALMVTLVAVAAFTRAEVDPWLRTSVRNDGLASLAYVANWRFIASNQAYFTAFAAPSPLRHMWSLAIEEQFYLLWPVLALVALRLGRGRRGLAAVCVAGIALSTVAMARDYRPGEPLRAYYGTDSRIHVILAGALLAVLLSVWPPGPKLRRLLWVAGPLALAAMLVSWVIVNGAAPAYYHGGSLVHAAAAGVVLLACLQPGPVRAVFGVGLLAWVGRLSYGLYLFHWPIIVWLVPNRVPLDGLALNAVRVGLTLVAAVTSYYLIELPVRERRPPTVLAWARDRLRPRAEAPPPGPGERRRVVPWLVAPAAVLTAVAVAASAGGATRPPDYLVGDQSASARLVAKTAAPNEEFHLGDPMPCGPPGPEAQAEARASLDHFPQPVTPGAGRLRILTVGDSAMCSLYPGLYASAGRSGGQIDTAAVIGCGVVSGEFTTTRGEQVTPNSHRCPGLVDAALDAALQRIDPNVVVWMSVWEKSDLVTDGGILVSGTPEHDREIQSRMDAALARLTAHGAHVVVLTVPAAAPNDAQGAANTSNAVDDASYLRLDHILRTFARHHPQAVTLVDVAARLCPAGPPCPAEVHGVRMRPDGRHLTPAAAAVTAHWLMPQLLDAAPAP